MKKRLDLLNKAATHLVLSFLCVLMVLPIVQVILDSFKSQRDMYLNPWGLPKKVLISNYSDAWSIGKIGDYYFNTLIVAVGSLIGIVFIVYLASFALARFRFRGKDWVMVAFVSTIMLPIQATIIPIYKIEEMLGIVDSLIGLILPYIAKAIPYSIFILTAFIRTLPIELDEAARIDGAGRMTVLTRIILPLSRPGLATIVILNFMNIWNDFYLPLVLIHDPSKRTLNLGLVNFAQLWGLVDYTRLFAAICIVSMPLVLVFVVFQRQFVSGLASGGIKG